MSLIQQALEKSNGVQGTRTQDPPAAPKPWGRDLLGADLEKKIIQVQENNARRRRLFWKVSLGALAVCVIAGLSYVGIQQIPSGGKSSPVAIAPATVAAPVAAQMPVRIDFGNIYRLTGITSTNGKSMAVINEEIVSVGDSLPDKAIVKAIGNGEVRLNVQGREIKLTL